WKLRLDLFGSEFGRSPVEQLADRWVLLDFGRRGPGPQKSVALVGGVRLVEQPVLEEIFDRLGDGRLFVSPLLFGSVLAPFIVGVGLRLDRAVAFCRGVLLVGSGSCFRRL